MQKLFCILMTFLLVGCSSLPSVQNCDNVSYVRKGINYHIEADCRVNVKPISIMPGIPGT